MKADSRLETIRNEVSYQPGHDRFVLVGLAGPAMGMEYPIEQTSITIGRSASCDVCISDDHASRRHVQLSLVQDPVQPERCFVLVQDLQSRNGVRINGASVSSTLLDGGEKILVGRTVFRLDRRDDFDIAHLDRLRALTAIDPLTGLGDRRALDEMLEACEAGRRSQQREYAVLMIDLDHFKRINDAFGHLAGDAALRHAAETIQRSLRSTDGAFRFGGEEFVVLLPGTGTTDANAVAQRIRAAIEATPARYEGRLIPMTASVGVVAGGADALHAADSALYDAKRSGRNRVHEAQYAMN